MAEHVEFKPQFKNKDADGEKDGEAEGDPAAHCAAAAKGEYHIEGAEQEEETQKAVSL